MQNKPEQEGRDAEILSWEFLGLSHKDASGVAKTSHEMPSGRVHIPKASKIAEVRVFNPIVDYKCLIYKKFEYRL